MSIKHAVVLLALAALLAGCSAALPDWARGDPNFAVPGITNNG